MFAGYANFTTAVGRVASTVAFVWDGDVRVILDPGMVPDPKSILEPLAVLGESPARITDVVFSHHHPDHTLNAALFPHARFHDHWANYQGDGWQNRVRVLRVAQLIVPGHGAPFLPDETTPR
jgi:glyoxylase-like metal-dependent hydrolase (beta-lactamase superfamily II)